MNKQDLISRIASFIGKDEYKINCQCFGTFIISIKVEKKRLMALKDLGPFGEKWVDAISLYKDDLYHIYDAL